MLRAEPAGKGHLGGGHGQAAFAQVVTGADQAGVDRRCMAAKVFLAACGSSCGHLAAGRATATRREMRAAQLVARHADEVQQIARLLEVHRHAAGHVVDLAQGADQQRRRNGDRLGGALGRNSLLRLSLPLMNGVPSTVATS